MGLTQPRYIRFCSCGQECLEDECKGKGWVTVTVQNQRDPKPKDVMMCPACWTRRQRIIRYVKGAA